MADFMPEESGHKRSTTDDQHILNEPPDTSGLADTGEAPGIISHRWSPMIAGIENPAATGPGASAPAEGGRTRPVRAATLKPPAVEVCSRFINFVVCSWVS